MASFNVSSRFAQALSQSVHAQEWVVSENTRETKVIRSHRITHVSKTGREAKRAFNELFHTMYEYVSVELKGCQCCYRARFQLRT